MKRKQRTRRGDGAVGNFAAERAALIEARDRAEAANRAKSAFLATMSHEIRTPLFGVLGMLDLLRLTTLNPDQRSIVDVVRSSGKGLQRIIDDILDFSRIEAGQLQILPEAVSVEALVRSVCDTYAGKASSAGLILEHRLDPRVSAAVQVDPVRLQQILNNFVSNALKFTERGRVGIEVDVVAQADAVQTLQFAVRDTGPGIAPEDQARLFQPFTQVQGGHRCSGSGLGLTICRRLAELMGGTIGMRSELGAGTTLMLTLTLPLADPAGLPAPGAAAPSLPVDSCRTPPTVAEAARAGTLVLVVDDHPINRRLIRMQVNCLGYAAEVAASGAEALQLWKSGRFGLILADCQMPEMDGYELARQIRALETWGGGAHVPIVACTANALRGDCDACLAAGMDDYLPKPVELATLEDRLSRWLPQPLREAA
jgi:CheY-like chemotaxis protein